MRQRAKNYRCLVKGKSWKKVGSFTRVKGSGSGKREIDGRGVESRVEVGTEKI